VLDDITMVSAIFFARSLWNQDLYYDAKHLCRTLAMKNMQIFFNLNKILSKFQLNFIFALKNQIFKKLLLFGSKI